MIDLNQYSIKGQYHENFWSGRLFHDLNPYEAQILKQKQFFLLSQINKVIQICL